MTELGDNFFRHEYGRLVAMLSRRVGVHNVEVVEDAVQAALGAAVETWPRSNIPDNPSAWLFRVAHNHVLGELRRSAHRADLALQHHVHPEPNELDGPQVFLRNDVRDDMLRMLFACNRLTSVGKGVVGLSQVQQLRAVQTDALPWSRFRDDLLHGSYVLEVHLTQASDVCVYRPS